MRILHVCQSDSEGGAAMAAARLHRALLDSGVDSHMAVIRNSGKFKNVDAPLGAFGRARVRGARFLSKRASKLLADYDHHGMRSLGVFPSGLGGAINKLGPDVVHLHWVGGEAMSLKEIAKIEKPLVWTLHDMWPFSGAHHWAELPKAYSAAHRSGSGALFNLEEWTRARKERVWGDLDCHFICPSDWMAQKLRQSPVFGPKAHSVIPNTLDINAFRPLDPADSQGDRDQKKKPLLLFGAVGGASNPIKGGDFLAPILGELRRLGHDPALAVFGGAAPRVLKGQVTELGRLNGDAELARAYSKADVFLCPSRVDNFPNTIIEAQCCGVPAVGFGSSGQVDALDDPSRTATPFDCSDFARIIAGILSEPPNPITIRQKTIERVAPPIVVEKHLNIYKRLVGAA